MEDLLTGSVGGKHRMRGAGICFLSGQMTCMEAPEDLREATTNLAMIHESRDHVSACIERSPCVLLMEKTGYYC